ncbi:DUF3576 domain-containing protein, partial [Pelagibacteraceae bacterium]|nr:DUF3576 domain-containing protein [Pelagibacteraceae bacterium]
DNRKVPVKGMDRAKQNIKEGRGVSLGEIARGRGKTNYEFSTSNPMWRATLETLDFLPLATVDYSGGLVITDWYTDTDAASDSLKITVRFLSNEIKTNSLKVIVHKRTCKEFNKCKTNILQSKISEELTRTILAKAVVLEKNKKR